MRRIAIVLLIACSATACTRPALLVCESVSADGVCRRPGTVLEGGRGYTLYATGRSMPTGQVTIRVVGARPNGRTTTATSRIAVPSSRAFLTSPLRLLYEGDYRITVFDEDGDEFRHITVHVARTDVRPVPPWQR